MFTRLRERRVRRVSERALDRYLKREGGCSHLAVAEHEAEIRDAIRHGPLTTSQPAHPLYNRQARVGRREQ